MYVLGGRRKLLIMNLEKITYKKHSMANLSYYWVVSENWQFFVSLFSFFLSTIQCMLDAGAGASVLVIQRVFKKSLDTITVVPKLIWWLCYKWLD